MVGRSYNPAAGLIALLMCVGCQETLSPQARQWLQTGYTASASGDHQKVVQTMDAFLADHARSARADEAYYLRGLAKYRMGDRAGARADLKAALDKTGKPELRGKAALALGDLAWEAEDMPTGGDMYRMAVDNMDAGIPPADHAAYRLACVLQRLGRWEEADVQFSRVMELFPDVELAERSARRIHSRSWAIQVAAFNDRARADEVARDLTGQGFRADVSPALGKGGPLFVVQTARFSTYEQATAALPSIKKLQSDAFVTATR